MSNTLETNTPETDKAEFVYNGIEASGYVKVEFAQQLERERDQWRECAERLDARLRKSTDWTPYATYKDNQHALAEFERLKGETK